MLLRLAPVDEKQERNIVGELEFISYLHEKDFPVLEPIKTMNNDLLITISTKWGCYYATAFKKVSGISIENTDFSPDIMFEYGKTLGKLHTLSSDFCPAVKKWSHVDVLYWIKDILQEYNAKDSVRLEVDKLEAELSNLPLNKNNYGLIHYDFELDNVFYDSKTKTCAVIDFDDGMYHWYALDIEQAFDSLREELTGGSLEAAKNEFLRGYMTERCYTGEMETMLPLMRRFINLYGYARLIRCIEEKLADEPEWLIDLRKKLERKISALETNITKHRQSYGN